MNHSVISVLDCSMICFSLQPPNHLVASVHNLWSGRQTLDGLDRLRQISTPGGYPDLNVSFSGGRLTQPTSSPALIMLLPPARYRGPCLSSPGGTLGGPEEGLATVAGQGWAEVQVAGPPRARSLEATGSCSGCSTEHCQRWTLRWSRCWPRCGV